jgi:hypothetical protein
MTLAARLDDFGKPAWIAILILSFFVWWPLGLGVLAYLIGSKRMSCWKHGGHGRERWIADSWRRAREPRSSGNRAFDDYRRETLERLEEEQKAFMAFLEQLRHARDKEEFDRFMAERAAKPA